MMDLNYGRNIAFIAGFYAEEHQLIQTAEECAELAQAAIKRSHALADISTPADRLRDTRIALIDELADTLVMIEQIIYLEGCEGDVRKIIGEKIDRQIGRIRASDQKSVVSGQREGKQ